MRLLLNHGNDAHGAPVFSDVTAEAGLPLAVRSKSASAHALDVDHDGHLDLVASVSSGTTLASAQPTVFRATGGRTAGGVPLFAAPPEIAAVRGPRTPDAAFSWVALPWADADRDGRVDLAGDHFFSYQGVRLFTGASASGHWLAVSLDTRSYTEVGARVAVYRAGGLGSRRHLLGTRTISATDGYASAVATEARFGLGSVPRVDVRVTLPPGRRPAVIDVRGLPADRSVRIGGTGRC